MAAAAARGWPGAGCRQFLEDDGDQPLDVLGH
jgi:hypothetical protein